MSIGFVMPAARMVCAVDLIGIVFFFFIFIIIIFFFFFFCCFIARIAARVLPENKFG